MKKNLFFDVGSTLHYPITGNWFITPNFFNILGNIDLDIVLYAIEKNYYLLDERKILTEDEEFNMFCKFYYNILKDMNYPKLCKEYVQALAYDCVYNDNKINFYNEVNDELKNLFKEYVLYIISDARTSTYIVLKNYGLYNLFKNEYIKSDKTLFEIALKNTNTTDENYFIDDRIHIKINNLTQLNNILKLYV